MTTLAAPVPLTVPNRVTIQVPAVLAFAAAAVGLAYSVSFVILREPVLAAGSLVLGGLLAVPVLLALAGHLLRPPASLAARSGVVLALVGAAGSAVHGAYDLANALHPPAMLAADLPNPIDPRGVLTFGVAGLALVVLGLVGPTAGVLPLWLSIMAVADGSLLLTLYVARLVVLDPASPFVLGPALLTGFVLGPAWYVGVGLWLLSAGRPRPRRSVAGHVP